MEVPCWCFSWCRWRFMLVVGGEKKVIENDLRKNGSGYADPTAYAGMKSTIKSENETDRKAAELIKVLKFIIRSCGFELITRIQVKETKSGREYK